jgi:amino acid transporter
VATFSGRGVVGMQATAQPSSNELGQLTGREQGGHMDEMVNQHHAAQGNRVQQTALAAAQEHKLVKTLRRSDIVLFIIAAVISMDTIGQIAAGGTSSLLWGVVLVAVFMVPYAMIFAETGGAFPQEGGPYQWVKFAYGRFWAGVTSVLYWITNPIWLGGSLAFIAYSAFSQDVVHVTDGSFFDWAFKIAFVWVAILLAIVSLKSGKIFVNVGAWAKVFVLVALIGTTAIYGIKHGFQHFDVNGLKPTAAGFLASAPIILFAYVGFEAPNAASEEMVDAARDTGPAIRRGSIISMVAYLLPVLAILLVVPTKNASGIAGYMDAVKTVFSVYGSAGGFLLHITAIAFIWALVNQGSSWMMATDRIQAVAAADGTFFGGFFGVFSERLGTPVRVNITSGVLSTIFVAAAMEIVNGSSAAIFKVVLATATATLLVSYLTIVPALMKLKRTFPEVPREYVVPGGNRGFMFAGGLCLFFVVVGTIDTLFPSVLPQMLGQSYSFSSSWGVSAGTFEGFTLGTLAVVVAIGVIGYLGAGRVRSEMAPGDLIDEAIEAAAAELP